MAGGHMLITGRTETGKTTLAKRICAEWRARGVECIILDPMSDPEWQASFITREPEEFLHVVRNSEQCACFIDEGSETAGRYDREMHWTATQGRHWGHRFHYISQRPKQLSVNVRSNCGQFAVFRLASEDAKELARDFAAPELNDAVSLDRGEFMYGDGFNQTRRERLF